MDPLTMLAISAGMKGVGGLTNYLINRRNIKNLPISPRFEESDYGKMLTGRTQTGIYSPEMQQNIINQVGGSAGSMAERMKSDYMGRLINRGIGGGIAAQRGLNEADRMALEQVAGIQSGLSTANEQSKIEAQNMLEQMKWQNKLQRYQDKLNKKLALGQNLGQFVGGTTDTLSTGINDAMLMNILSGRFGGMGNEIAGAEIPTAQAYTNFPMPRINYFDSIMSRYGSKY